MIGTGGKVARTRTTGSGWHPRGTPRSRRRVPAFCASHRASRDQLTIKVAADDKSAVTRRRQAVRIEESAAGALAKAPWDELQPLPLTLLPRNLIKRVIARHLNDALLTRE